jgi:hypothetical protein
MTGTARRLIRLCTLLVGAVLTTHAALNDVVRSGAKTVVYLPLADILTKGTGPLDELTIQRLEDTALMKAADTLVCKELAVHFKLAVGRETINDSIRRALNPADSSFAAAIGKIAAASGADLVALVKRCTITESAVQAAGWRSGSSPSYERPRDYTAAADLSIQLWSKDGKLAYQQSATGRATPKAFYFWLNKKQKKQPLGRWVKSLYAPPVVRALYDAVKGCLPRR